MIDEYLILFYYTHTYIYNHMNIQNLSNHSPSLKLERSQYKEPTREKETLLSQHISECLEYLIILLTKM